MNNPFDQINIQSKEQTNNLLNESERNNTIATDVSGYSTFDKSFQQATTFNSGQCIPVFLQECYPGDIYEIDVNAIVRLSAPASTPLMNINWDLNFFYVPFNQLDLQFKNLMGENESYGYSDTNLNFPFLDFTSSFSYSENDLANYFNIPINIDFYNTLSHIQIYPFLAYGKVWNEWYRDQNLQSSIDISTCFNSTRSLNVSNYNSISTKNFYSTLIYGKGLAPCSKFPNYFTTCLPYQQKGSNIPLSFLNPNDLIINPLRVVDSLPQGTLGPVPLLLYDRYGKPFSPDYPTNLYSGHNNSNNNTYVDGYITPEIPGIKKVGATYVCMSTKATQGAITGPSSTFTINDLRYSIVSQHLLENWALCGSRYVEQLKSIWGIEIDPKNINRTELIGGVNESLIFNNVQQTSQTSNDSQLGAIASNLYNSVSCPHISYASSQHGYIIGILTTRTTINNGAQGLPKLFAYNDFLDFFNPLFNGIGEQPVLNQEIYLAESNLEQNNSTFGFNEPFLNTKYNIDNANGYLSLNSKQSLFSQFLFGEKYDSIPKLCDAWIRYNPNIIGNSLFKVDESNNEFYHQFLALFTYNVKYTTRQPLFNSPRVYGV